MDGHSHHKVLTISILRQRTLYTPVFTSLNILSVSNVYYLQRGTINLPLPSPPPSTHTHTCTTGRRSEQGGVGMRLNAAMATRLLE